MIAAGMAEASHRFERLFLDSNMTQGEVCALAGGEAVVYSRRSPAKEEGNEDAAALIGIDAARGVLAVADGVGGGRAGAQAAGTALRELAGALREVPSGESLRGEILDGFERANRAVIDLGIGAATTLAAVEIQDSSLRPYHAGDSTILVTGQRGKLKLLTVSHSPVGYAVESGLLGEQEAMHHEDRHLISNTVGSPDMRIEIGSVLSLAPATR
jgi:serine/threonine protein phosphatase PrpC